MEQVNTLKEGIVCHASDVVDLAYRNLETETPGLHHIKMSYRSTILMFMNTENGEFKVTFKKFWIFAIIIAKTDGGWGKLIEYIETEHEDWAKEIAYIKAINHFNDYLNVKVK